MQVQMEGWINGWMEGWRGRTRGSEAAAEPAAVLRNLPVPWVGRGTRGAASRFNERVGPAAARAATSAPQMTQVARAGSNFVRDDFQRKHPLQLKPDLP